MSEKKEQVELTEEELENVNGGCGNNETWEEKTSKYLPKDHGPHIGESDAKNHIGQKCYFVIDEHTDSYCWGTLVRVYEKQIVLNATRKMYEVQVFGQSGPSARFKVGTKDDIEGDFHTIYLYK